MARHNAGGGRQVKRREPTVCVVMPAYRSGHTLERAMISVLQQSYERLVLGVALRHDDADTISAFARIRDDRVVPVWVKKPGIATARNAVLQTLKADAYMFLDSDDEYATPRTIATFVEDFVVHPEPALRYADWIAVNPVTGRRQTRNGLTPGLEPHRRLLLGNFIATCAVMIDQAIVRNIGGFNEHYPHAEDWDLWLRISRSYPLRHVAFIAALYTHTKVHRIYPRDHFAHEIAIVNRQDAPWALRQAASLLARGRYGGYYVRTFSRRRTTSQLADVRLGDLLAFPIAAGLRLVRYRRIYV